MCGVLKVPRNVCQSGRKRKEKGLKRIPHINEDLAEKIRILINEYPTYGYRRIWALLKFRDGTQLNKKTVHRILKLKGWLVTNRSKTPKPRVKKKRSRTENSNIRWATDMTHIQCGEDGWGNLVAVIECCDSSIIGYEFALRGRAREAERAIENAFFSRINAIGDKAKPVIRSDNGLIFQSHKFRKTCKNYGLSQEFITPRTLEKNEMIERFLRSIKEECVCIKDFTTFKEADSSITEWIKWYNEGRPHQSLGYLSPMQFIAKKQGG